MKINGKQLKKQLVVFRDKLKEYQNVCREMWKAKADFTSDKISELRKKEEPLREELTEMWGGLEKFYGKIGISVIGNAYGRQFSIFDEALSSDVFDNPVVKGESLAMAVQMAIKAVGVVGYAEGQELIKDEKLRPKIGQGSGQSKIKRRLKSKGYWVRSTTEGKDEHLFIGKRNDSGDKVHLVIDGETGEVRIDPKDQAPHELLRDVETILRIKNGEKIRSTRTSLEFIEDKDDGDKIGPNVSVYTSDKEGYFLLEVYNSGTEDVEDFKMEAFWTRPEGKQRRILKFIDETERPIWAHPQNLNILRKGEKKYAANVPMKSVDKKILIKVSCKGVNSGKRFIKNFEFETPMQH